MSYDKYYKVQACAFFAQGKCRNGGKLDWPAQPRTGQPCYTATLLIISEYCRFAHGEDELRARAPSVDSDSSVTPPSPSSVLGEAEDMGCWTDLAKKDVDSSALMGDASTVDSPCNRSRISSSLSDISSWVSFCPSGQIRDISFAEGLSMSVLSDRYED
ncbi:hypothetical protein GNI_004670 [Gregarina niphandrodes]|uniref:Uncharacterized protein n=1 Tax=Gregarina niphandrodes TaxID=110365 RepID=A0A023BDD2_GRENI|nr:hypothetical protein GNI_004670 [Gregarina niphandrodes]EZG88387.1 hypothetical protein GNI_004670 [Gregarina niphandrodes]|eukprot:XP_011128561.1 hypothetical protein GNI_004670 [Gregarina niphandrodes]